MPRLAIIIPTLNRDRMFHDTVRQVLAQGFTGYHLHLIDQSDPPQRARNEAFVAACADPRLRYVHLSRKGLPNARNEGLARLAGDEEVVLFLDDDVILLDPGFLDAHLRCYADPRVGGVTGRIVERSVVANHPGTTNHLSPGGRTITNLSGTAPCAIATLKGANMSYRMEAVRQVGGFDRRYDGSALLEDADYSTRIRHAGWGLRFEPAAELIHLSSPSGGVREGDDPWQAARRYERYRFKSTAYFQLKHRGPAAFPLFAACFGAIALSRAARWRDPEAIRDLAAGAAEGVRGWREGPDQGVPGWDVA